MATFYQKRDIWHISVTHNGKRATRSLRTANKEIAKNLRPVIESELLAEVCGITSRTKNPTNVETICVNSTVLLVFSLNLQNYQKCVVNKKISRNLYHL